MARWDCSKAPVLNAVITPGAVPKLVNRNFQTRKQPQLGFGAAIVYANF